MEKLRSGLAINSHLLGISMHLDMVCKLHYKIQNRASNCSLHPPASYFSFLSLISCNEWQTTSYVCRLIGKYLSIHTCRLRCNKVGLGISNTFFLWSISHFEGSSTKNNFLIIKWWNTYGTKIDLIYGVVN